MIGRKIVAYQGMTSGPYCLKCARVKWRAIENDPRGDQQSDYVPVYADEVVSDAELRNAGQGEALHGERCYGPGEAHYVLGGRRVPKRALTPEARRARHRQ